MKKNISRCNINIIVKRAEVLFNDSLLHNFYIIQFIFSFLASFQLNNSRIKIEIRFNY
jgi:hypothetical protein